ncbi:MAG: hypothetical protein JOZ27_03850, partial [Caulobacteraceae bacterium]|nr:hypothetical protein [Caulobacteraceae bacterium]
AWTRQGDWVYLTYGGVNQTTPIDGTPAGQVSGASANTTTVTAPALSGLTAGDTVVNGWNSYGGGMTTPPSTENQFYNTDDMVNDQVIAGTSTTAQSATMSNGEGHGVSFAIKPS